MKALVVGDIHVKTNNVPMIKKLNVWLLEIISKETPDIVVLLGDILDYHEKILTTCMNTAYDLIRSISSLLPVYVLVGNHDYISNMQFLTNNHWMNGMKEWRNVTVVDKVLLENIKSKSIVFCPYLPPGRFEEALQTVDGSLNADIIFCHQEFLGADMGIIKSVTGDKYNLKALCVSGHIHDNQTIGSVYYVGSPLSHAFGEKGTKVICILEGTTIKEVEVPFGMKKSVCVSVNSVEDITISTSEETRIVITGTVAECKAFRKTKKYKELSKTSKIVFRTDNLNIEQTEKQSFLKICEQNIGGDQELLEMFQSLL